MREQEEKLKSKYGRAWQTLLATSRMPLPLKKRGFKMSVDDAAVNVPTS